MEAELGIIFPVLVGTISFAIVPTLALPVTALMPGLTCPMPSGAVAEIDIWRAAYLIVNWYGQNALAECGKRADERRAAGDIETAAIWQRITEAVRQLANTTPPGPLH
jgi:hypothetical protein